MTTTDGASRYDVANTWTFSETDWSTDLWDVLAAALNSGQLPEAVALPLGSWIPSDGSTYAPSSLFADPFQGKWVGVTDSSALLATLGGNGLYGYGALWKFTRYTASDGTSRAEFGSPAQFVSIVIDCGEDP